VALNFRDPFINVEARYEHYGTASGG